MPHRGLRKKVFLILEGHDETNRTKRIVGTFILSLIVLNAIALALETVKSIYNLNPTAFYWFETISISIFTIEYILRIWSCTEAEKYAFPVLGRLRFARTPFAVVDILAILPFYLAFIPFDLRFMRVVRLFRVFRIAKVARYSTAFQSLRNAVAAKKEELLVVSFLLFILLFLASSLMYFIENKAQPDAFSSIPAAMWWGVATLTPASSGAMLPITTAGKILGSLIAVLGLGMFALPTGILGAEFVAEIQRKRDKRKKCRHCGKEINS